MSDYDRHELVSLINYLFRIIVIIVGYILPDYRLGFENETAQAQQVGSQKANRPTLAKPSYFSPIWICCMPRTDYQPDRYIHPFTYRAIADRNILEYP